MHSCAIGGEDVVGEVKGVDSRAAIYFLIVGGLESCDLLKRHADVDGTRG